MRTLEIFQVNSFTRQPFSGNPAGVVPDARGLSDSEMQLIARELNLSETAFVLPASDKSADVTVRFFTPSTEVPICGHATIAAHFILASTGAGSATRIQHTGAGPLRVETVETQGTYQIWMHQKPAEFSSPFDGQTVDRIVKALGIQCADLLTDYPVQVVSTGHSKIMIAVRRRACIAAMHPDAQALIDISKRVGCNGFYPWTLDRPDEGCLTHGRMFAPAIGITEDPVTGNASGCLGAYMIQHGLLPLNDEGVAFFYAGQGHELGRPGRVLVEGRRQHPGDPVTIRIAGEAVTVIKGLLELPQ